MKFIRMISSVHKWDGTNRVKREDATICGDAISDLRTTGNKLSIWLGDNDEDIDDALVALALARSNVQKIVCLGLDENELSKMQITAETESGKVGGLGEAILRKHRNLVDIDYKRLGMLAEYMSRLASDKQNHIEYLKKGIKELLDKYEREGKIDKSKVGQGIKNDMGW